MTSVRARVAVVLATVLVFLVAVGAIAARPWQSEAASPSDPRLAELDRRATDLQDRAQEVQRVLDRRFADYRRALRARKAEIAAARKAHRQAVIAADAPQAEPATPIVRVVTLPAVAQTRSS